MAIITKKTRTKVSSQLKVNVRMYCHGLGDCFLLTFCKGKKKFNMLIDCGILQHTESEKVRLAHVAKDIFEITGGKFKPVKMTLSAIDSVMDEKGKLDSIVETRGNLDLVVATHEHHDHICGFAHADYIFDQIDFNEVWVAWTEDLNNDLARSLRDGTYRNLKGLSVALEQMKDSQPDAFKIVGDLLHGFLGESLSVASKKERSKGWKYVLDKNKPKKPKYCYPGGSTLSLKGFEDEVRVYVLGPPDNREKLRDLSAPQTEKFRPHFAEMLINDGFSMEESFFFALDAGTGEVPPNSPFDEGVGIKQETIKNKEEEKNKDAADETAQQAGDFFQKYYFKDDKRWRNIDYDWLSMTSELALKMDSYTNNTSLVLAIELIKSKKVLLFAADAQFGNWKSWHDHTWKIKEKDDTFSEVKTKDLLANTVLYKVGHHGSHNATLRESGLEMMTSDELVALIPVDTKRAKDKKWEMPFGALLDELQRKTKGRVLTSDLGHLPSDENKDWKAFKVDKEEKLFQDDPEKKSVMLFIDYEISE